MPNIDKAVQFAENNLDKAVQFAEAIAKDNSHGYAQDRRGGNPDFDCSSLIGSALNYAGFNVSRLSTTSTLHTQLLASGFQDIPLSVPRQRGDIFLTPGRHVVMCTDANNIVHASINEHGGVNNGMPGDQTGNEICIRSFYNPSYGWKYHMRFGGISQSQTAENPKPTLKLGSSGEYVLAWQKYLNTLGYGLVEDGQFGQKTKNAVIDFQMRAFPNQPKEHDGIIGAKTWDMVGKVGAKSCSISEK